MKKHFCCWYDETSAMKRAYDKGLIDKKWVENYCWNEGKNCIRKKDLKKNNLYHLIISFPMEQKILT